MPHPREEIEVGMAQFVDRSVFSPGELQSCVVVVSGPDQDGEITLLAGAETYLPKATALRLAAEIMARVGATLAAEDAAKDMAAKIHFLVNWADQQGLLEDHVFTFPDGDLWEAKG